MRQLDNPHDIATGKWYSILPALGVHDDFLKKKHGPCPMCGGKDRFRFDNKEGRGTFICNQCGAGDGFKLLEMFHGWSFKDALARVKEVAGHYAPVAEKRSAKQSIEGIKSIWFQALEVEVGDPVWLYLNRRTGISDIPRNVRYHPALSYIDEDGAIDHHPALVAVISGPDGLGLGLQRIYLTKDGQKANVESQKKTLGTGLGGAAVRLFKAGGALGIAEGIETALSAAKRFDVPVWAALSATLLEQWTPPAGVTRVMVFGDNDNSFTGQASAYSLAKRLSLAGLDVSVHIPEQAGTDWAD